MRRHERLVTSRTYLVFLFSFWFDFIVKLVIYKCYRKCVNICKKSNKYFKSLFLLNIQLTPQYDAFFSWFETDFNLIYVGATAELNNRLVFQSIEMFMLLNPIRILFVTRKIPFIYAMSLPTPNDSIFERKKISLKICVNLICESNRQNISKTLRTIYDCKTKTVLQLKNESLRIFKAIFR